MEEPKPNHHVVVDEVRWSRTLLFPRLGRAFGMAAQPSRLIMGLAVIVILMVSGAAWDAIAGRVVSPSGIGSPMPEAQVMEARLEQVIRDSPISGTVAEDSLREDNDEITPEEARDALIAWYRELDDEARNEMRSAVETTLGRLDGLEPQGVFEATVQMIFSFLESDLELSDPLSWPEQALALGAFKIRLIGFLWETHPVFLVLFGIWTTIVLLLAGGMISRSVACEFAINQYISWTEALAFALRRWMAILGTIVLPAIIVLVGLLLLAIGGLLFRVPGLDIVGGVLYAAALFGGFLLAVILVLWTLGAGLLVPAVAVESADAPDALSRAFAYVKNRPLHYVWYVFVAMFIGFAGFLVVAGLAFLTINLSAVGAAAIFPGGDEITAFASARGLTDYQGLASPIGLGVTGRVTVAIIGIWKTIIGGLVAGYLVSYAWSAWTVIYFLLRRAVDDQDIEEIWLPGMIEGTLAPERAATGEAE